LWAADHGETTRSAADCRAVCIRATAQEQQVDYAFFAANDRLKLLLLRDRLRVESGLLLEGMVVRETADGVTVFLPEFGLFGLLPGKGGSVNRGWSEGAGKRGGRGTGKTHKCGDFIMAQPRTVDCVRGTLELQPARVRLPGSGFRPARARA
jgi:exoribonuclease R